MIVDSHTHLFAPDPVRYPLADPTASYRPLNSGLGRIPSSADDRGGGRSGGDYFALALPLGYELRSRRVTGQSLVAGGRRSPGPAEFRWAGAPRSIRERAGCLGAADTRTTMNLGPYDDPATTPLWRKAADLGIALDACAALDEYPQLAKRAQEFPICRSSSITAVTSRPTSIRRSPTSSQSSPWRAFEMSTPS